MYWNQRYIAALITCLLIVVVSIASYGQVLKGSISGTATDPAGAVIPGAQVKATNNATAAVLTTSSDSSGNFRFSLIPAGDYKIEISAPNFNSAEKNNVAVTAGRDTGLGAIKLSVGQASTTVEVTAGAPLIESTQSQVTNTFTGTALSTFVGVQENEGLDNLAIFVPGVVPARDSFFSNANGGTGFAVNGLRGRNNDQQIDGQNNNDNSVAGPSTFVTDPEWVSQYVLVTNQFGPEYGRNAGSVVNIITKSGTNAWHGSVYGNENNSVLNSMTNFQKNFDIDPLTGRTLTHPPRMNDEFTGFQIGGPVIKNKAFLAGGFNQQVISTNNSFSSGAITPTPAGLTALAACFPTGAGAQAVTAVSRFGAFGVSGGNPVPTNVTTGVVTACPQAEFGQVTRNLATPDHIYDFYVRTDLQLGSDSIVGRYIYNRNTFFNTDQPVTNPTPNAAGYPVNQPTLSQAVLMSWTHNISSRMVNELRGSFGRENAEFGGNTIGNTVQNQNQLAQGLTNVTFQNPNANLGFGPDPVFPQGRIVNTWQGQDNWNYVRGKHTFKAGVNFTYQRSPNIFLPNINGQFRFDDWDAFFANTPNRVRIAQGASSLDFREYDTFIYFGDDWKATRSLTLNLGLTWSYYGQPANLFNDITVPRESNPNTAFWNPALPLSVRTDPKIDTPLNSFGPSFGFAWSPQGGGKWLNGTVIRGGYRLLYDPPFYNIYLNVSTSAPATFLQTITGATAAATPLSSNPTGPNVRTQLAPALQTGVFDPRTFNQTTIIPRFKPDMVHAWSLGLQHEVTKKSAVEVRYIGNAARKLFQSLNGNPFIADLQSSFPQFVPRGLTPCPSTQQLPPFPLVNGTPTPTDVGRVTCGNGVIRQRANTGYSNYNGVQFEYRADNLMNQLTLRFGYTYSKNLDNVSEIFGTGGAGNTIEFAQNPAQQVTGAGEYSFSGLDYPHTGSITVTEQLPFFKEQHGTKGHLLGGWGVSGNYYLQDGQRYTPTQISELAAFSSAGDFFDSAFVNAFEGVDVARPFFGNRSAPRNSVGAFAGDACFVFGVTGTEPVCTISPTTLVSVNALNASGAGITGAPVTVNPGQVRYILNGGAAQGVFGTPFGNVPRNLAQDAISNLANISVSKNTKINERTSFELRASFINAFNHPNYQSIDPFLEDASGTPRAPFFGFADPTVTNNVPGPINFPVEASRRIVFGGVLRF
jgi:hypothetical protein